MATDHPIKRLLLYEPTHTGHHFPYLARMLPGFVDLPIEILLATTEIGARSDEFEKYVLPFADRLDLNTSCVEAVASKRTLAFRRAAEVARLSRDIRCDHVMILYADGLWQAMALMRLCGKRLFEPQVTVEGILYRGAFTYPGASDLRSRLMRRHYRRMLRQRIFDRLMLDDEYLFDFAESAAAGTTTATVLTANPVAIRPPITREDARGELGIAREGRIISLSGMIDTRKGADLLIDAYATAAQRGLARIRLLLAGPHHADIQRRLAMDDARRLTERGSIISMDRLLSEDDMFTVAAASDLVTAPYPNHSGRSSVILWAAAAGRPVLAVDRGCIARVVTTEKLGYTCQVTDRQTFASSIIESLDTPWTQDDAERSIAYAQFHDVTNYQQINSALVRQRLAQTAAPR